MKELIMLLIIGIGLSLDAFSVSTCIGMSNLSMKKILNTSLTVGLFHFVMPILGFFISNQITKYMLINTDIILGIILLLISTQMFIEYIKPSTKEINLKRYGVFLFALGVSLDSFSVGIGLKAITDNLLLSSTVFSICSFSFTFLGLSLGKYINKLCKQYSYLIGAILLFFIGIVFLLKIF
ncbi:MAG: manganese efflux pump [Bacilli bacterium]|nr:manganese efflux pump [Bacilli bacterium]